MRPLEGRVVALLESRRSDDIAELVRRMGGRPLSAPALREMPRLEEATEQIRTLAAGDYHLAVFLTGAGTTALLKQAETIGLLTPSLDALRRIAVAARGPKPLGVLKRYGVPVAVATARPHTSIELLAGLAALRLDNPRTLLVHYGERNAELAVALRAHGARLDEACPYEWALPEDSQPLAALTIDVLNDRVDAMLFTSQVQARHLFQIAAEMRLAHELAAAINRGVIVGAVGPVCATALRAVGVTPDVMPDAPNMTALIAALGDYFSLLQDEPEPGVPDPGSG